MRRFLGLLLLAYASIASAESSFTFEQPRGPHAVGFRAVFQYDGARTFQLDAASPPSDRPIQTLIWYPAKDSGKPMRYREYAEFSVTQFNFKQTPEEIQVAFAGMLQYVPLKGEALEFELARPQWATRDATPLKGKFPVVVYAASVGGAAYENADLCELLASHGYVVISTHSLGKDGDGMTMNRAGLDLQVGDIHFLMKFASQIAQADTSKIAIVGYSWGGISNAFAAVDKPHVLALVFLDGSVRYFASLLDNDKLNGGKRLPIPMLYFSSGNAAFKDDLGKTETGATLLPHLTSGKSYLLKMERMTHADFASFQLRQTPPAGFAPRSPRDVSASYGWVAQYTLQFLDASLKGDRKAGAFMERNPSANHVPDGLISAIDMAKP